MPDIFQDSSRYFHISAFYALSLPYYHMEHHTHSSYENGLDIQFRIRENGVVELADFSDSDHSIISVFL